MGVPTMARPAAGLVHGQTSPNEHLLTPTALTVKSICWQVPPHTFQFHASSTLTTSATRAANVGGHSLCWEALPLQPLANSCSAFTISSRAAPRESLCLPVWVEVPFFCAASASESLGVHFIHSFIHSTHPCQAISHDVKWEPALPKPYMKCQGHFWSPEKVVTPKGPLSGKVA